MKDYKKEKLRRLNLEYSKLPYRRKDWRLSRNFVAGEGPTNAKIMIIGQAPGAKEDALKSPFVGRSGKLLTDALSKAGIERKNVYITSVVQFFPPNNRAPSRKEIELCKPFLFKQIDIIKPKFVILLGNIALHTVLGKENISKEHGKAVKKKDIIYFVTFHPAAALRSAKAKKMFIMDIEKFARILKRT